jgi:cytidine deaminase
MTTARKGPKKDIDMAALARAARAALKRAYAPYSKFRVGAALLGESGTVHVGFNVENISYGLSMCAERTAVYSAMIAGERDFRAIAIATDSPTPISPCGACRQVLTEFCADMPVLLVPTRGRSRRYTLRQLMPAAFFDFPGSKRPARR